MNKPFSHTGPLSRARRRLGIALAAILGTGMLAGPIAAEYDEYKVKAAFLLNFARLVTWPQDAPGGNAVVIGLIGDAKATRVLAGALEGSDLSGRPVRVRRIAAEGSCGDCRILFLARKGEMTPERLLAITRGEKVLTVSEVPGFASQGGMINFFPDGRKLRFEINPAAAEREGLKISSRLLALARVIEGSP